MTEINFNNLPEAVAQISNQLSEIRRLIERSNEQHNPEADRWFDLNELCSYLPDKPARATVYGWVHHGLIPHHKKTKKLQFLKSEIDAWIKAGRRKTVSELETEAKSHLSSHKKKNH